MTAAGTSTSTFGNTLATRVAERESQIVLGLDPDPAALWPKAHRHDDGPEAGPRLGEGHPEELKASPRSGEGRPEERGASPRSGEGHPEGAHALRTAIAVRVHCCALIDAAGPACVAVKPQLACFERLGVHGWETLDAVCAHARNRGLLVIADGKRGDIAISARAYAEALYERLGADLATVNPLLGRDSLEPFVAAARARGAGVLVLVRTSNPGAADVQDLRLASGEAVWERLAALVSELGGEPAGADGLSDVGAVVGTTQPRHLERARELMPHAVLLLPGVGAQGGRVEDLGPAFAPGRAGGLVTASRSIAGAHLADGGDPAEAARAEAERLRAAAWSLSA